MEKKITITRLDVMGKVEALTTMLSLHNPGVDLETIWASQSDQSKLDLYWHEAINDIEQKLIRWVKSTTAQTQTLAEGSDYTITLTLSDKWQDKLEGLLANKMQDYFAYTLMASWMADFPEGAPVHPDYTAMAVADLDDIQTILMEKDLSATEYSRQTDYRSSDSFTLEQEERSADTEEKDEFILHAVPRADEEVDDDTVNPRNDHTNWGL